MKSKIYVYFVVHTDTDGIERLIGSADVVVAKNEEEARIEAARGIPKEYKSSVVEIVMRPF